ncbi:MAG TPA: DUF695 domain-containing protein [Feifaniaceae bacterium]|nr:DUF695 domain-containing protein [Feifaniaceae bacterium]
MRKQAEDTFFSYVWPLQNARAHFTVDTGYDEPMAGYEALVYCALSPHESGAEAFTPREERRCDKIERKLLRALPDAVYVGVIDMDALRQYYFYVRDAEEAMAEIERIAGKEKLLSVSPGSAHEPDWLTYHALLLPDAAKYQTVLNAEMIGRLKKSGDNLAAVRRMTFSMCFPSEQTRLLFQEQAKAAGFAIGEPQFKPELDLPHILTIHALSALVQEDVDDLTTRAIRAAEPFGGELLRWNCPVMPKRSPLA